MSKEVYWHLPGLCSFRMLNQLIIRLMNDYPERFKEGYKIGSVYGSFPGAIWNGGRTVMGFGNKSDIMKTFKVFNDLNVPVRFTWTNSLLEEKHVYDTYCNMIMQLGDNGFNQVLVNRPVLEEYIRKEYPNYPLISSTTKRIVTVDDLIEEIKKDYHLVVLDYDMNHNEEALAKLEPYASKVEILVNEICYPGCKMRSQHYLDESRRQLEYDMEGSFPCPNKTQERTFAECKDRPAFISDEEIGSYIDRGFVNFKIVGRGLPMEFAVDSYLYYLVKPEYRNSIRGIIDSVLAQYRRMQKR